MTAAERQRADAALAPLLARTKVRGSRRTVRSKAPGHKPDTIRYEKIAVSLSLRAAESARRAVKEGRSPSVSAYIASAVEEKSSREDLITMLDEMLDETGGPMTPAEQRWVDYQLAPKRSGRPPKWPASFGRRPKQERKRKR